MVLKKKVLAEKGGNGLVSFAPSLFSCTLFFLLFLLLFFFVVVVVCFLLLLLFVFCCCCLFFVVVVVCFLLLFVFCCCCCCCLFFVVVVFSPFRAPIFLLLTLVNYSHLHTPFFVVLCSFLPLLLALLFSRNFFLLFTEGPRAIFLLVLYSDLFFPPSLFFTQSHVDYFSPTPSFYNDFIWFLFLHNIFFFLLFLLSPNFFLPAPSCPHLPTRNFLSIPSCPHLRGTGLLLYFFSFSGKKQRKSNWKQAAEESGMGKVSSVVTDQNCVNCNNNHL